MSLPRSAGWAACGVLIVCGLGCGEPDLAGRTFATDLFDLVPVEVPNLASINEDNRVRVHRRELVLREVLGDSDSTDLDMGEAFGELGRAYLSFGFPESAVGCFTNANSFAPKAYRWPHYLAVAKTQLGESSGAVEAAERALALRPEAVATLVLLGDAHLVLNHAEDAHRAYSRAVSLTPGCAAAWYGLGQTALAQDDFDGAVGLLETALRLQPAASMVHYPLAMAYRGLGKISKAEEHIGHSGNLRPVVRDPLMLSLEVFSIHSWIHRGTQALQSNRPGAAADILGRAVAEDSDNLHARLNYGVALARVGDLDRALDQYFEALRIDPDYYVVHTHLGTLLLAMDRRDEAVEHLRRAIDLNSEDYRAHMNLSLALRADGKKREALIHVEEVIRLDPKHEMARAAKARHLAGFGECEEAVACLEESLGLLPDSIVLMSVLVRVLSLCPLESTRDPGRSVSLATQAFDRSQSLENAVSVALAYAAAGEFDRAEDWQRIAINILPDRPEAEKTREKLTHDLELYQQREMPGIEW